MNLDKPRLNRWMICFDVIANLRYWIKTPALIGFSHTNPSMSRNKPKGSHQIFPHPAQDCFTMPAGTASAAQDQQPYLWEQAGHCHLPIGCEGD